MSYSVQNIRNVCLLGHSGSGKTTLMNMIAGIYFPDEGEIYVGDEAVTIRSPRDALDLGIGMIHQHFKLVDVFSATENIALSMGGKDKFDLKRVHDKARAICEKYEFNLDLNQKVYEMSVSQKQTLEIVKVLYRGADILILDEPTNHLDMRSKDVLKEAIREFDGTVILVSHDRDFLDGLATKVYEFGGGTVKEHLGGIYDFLQKKKIDSLNELQKGVSLSTSPTASAKGNEADTEQPSENRLSYEAQKELNKKIKKLERQVADCEASIEETESAIAILEAKMATPEGASDMQLYERHQKLKQQLDTTVEEWERVSMELEEVKN